MKWSHSPMPRRKPLRQPPRRTDVRAINACTVGLSLAAITLLAACARNGGSAAGSDDVRTTAWQLTSVSGRDLAIRFVAGGGCYGDTHVDHTESATTVTITVTTRKNTNSTVCTQNLAVGLTTVHLRQPLGTRSLIHPTVQFGPPRLLGPPNDGQDIRSPAAASPSK